MILEFVNKFRMNVKNIFGGPINVNGIIRDVLSIEIEPDDSISINDIKAIFNNTKNLAFLYTYELDYIENGDLVNKKLQIGEGYTILLGVEEVTRKLNNFPGTIAPERFETLYIVNIAQLTYDEWMIFRKENPGIKSDPDGFLPPEFDIDDILLGRLLSMTVTELEDTPIKNIS